MQLFLKIVIYNLFQDLGFSDFVLVRLVKWPLNNPIKRMKISFKCVDFKVANIWLLVLYLVSLNLLQNFLNIFVLD